MIYQNAYSTKLHTHNIFDTVYIALLQRSVSMSSLPTQAPRSQNFREAMRSGDFDLANEFAAENHIPLTQDELDDLFSVARERHLWKSLFANIAHQYPSIPEDKDELEFLRSLVASCIQLALTTGEAGHAEYAAAILGRKVSLRQLERCFVNASCAGKEGLANDALARIMRRRAGVPTRGRHTP